MPRYVSLEAVGAPPNGTKWAQWYCDQEAAGGDEGGVPSVRTSCSSDTCATCGASASAASLGLDGCRAAGGGGDDDGAVEARWYSVSCERNGVPVATVRPTQRRWRPPAGALCCCSERHSLRGASSLPCCQVYSDSACATAPLARSPFPARCNPYETAAPSDALWAGGYLRKGSVVVLASAASDKLGASTFHNVYFPIFANYNNPAAELDFDEAHRLFAFSACVCGLRVCASVCLWCLWCLRVCVSARMRKRTWENATCEAIFDAPGLSIRVRVGERR